MSKLVLNPDGTPIFGGGHYDRGDNSIHFNGDDCSNLQPPTNSGDALDGIFELFLSGLPSIEPEHEQYLVERAKAAIRDWVRAGIGEDDKTDEDFYDGEMVSEARDDEMFTRGQNKLRQQIRERLGL